MKTEETVTFDQIREQAISCQPLRINAKLAELQLLDRGHLEFSGRIHLLNQVALDGLCKVLGVAKSTIRLLEDFVSPDAKDRFVETIRAAISASTAGNIELTLLFQPKTKQLISIQKACKPSLSNETFCDVSEDLLSKHGLELSSYSIQENGDVIINAVQPLSHYWEVAGLKDEAFTGGVSISNSIDKGTQLNSFLNRLICSNGMVSTEFDECVRLEQINDKGIGAFINGILGLAKRDFKPNGFDGKVHLASTTPASLHELEHAAKGLMRSADLAPQQIEQWIPYQSTINAFRDYGVKVKSLSAAQKKQAKTGQSIWQLINGITHYATHENGISLSAAQRSELQLAAGNLFSSDFQLANNIRGPY